MNDDLIKSLREIAVRLTVQDIAGIVLDDPQFARWSGSSKPHLHHYGDGGLARHTHEVVTLCFTNAPSLSLMGYPVPSAREIYLAALFHDVGKMWDYEAIEHPSDIETVEHTTWQSAPHKRLVHHISRSAIEWSRAVDRFPAYRGIEGAVLHAILAHHGQREWGSPVAPKTRLAWLLHLCDGLSARFNDADTLDVVSS